MKVRISGSPASARLASSATRPPREAPVSPLDCPRGRVPDHFPKEWKDPGAAGGAVPARRDLGLDLVRGLAMMILIFNHTAIDSGIERLTGSVVSAAEMLILVSGVVVGVVFGGRWRRVDGRATTGQLLRRSRKLYLASVAVVAIVWGLSFLPALATDALATSPTANPAIDSYAYESVPRTLLAIVALEAGPWQINVLGFFIAILALAPAALWALGRGWWPLVLTTTLALYWLEGQFHPDVLPFQSERPFPLLTWQLLFVGGLTVGWHRPAVARFCGRHRQAVVSSVILLGAVSATAILGGPLVLGSGWDEWRLAHFDKGTLDPLRITAMASLTSLVYLTFKRFERSLGRLAAPLLLPLGQNSLYVFLVHAFLCLMIASVPLLASGDGLGLLGNSLVEVAGLLAIWLMVKRRFLFRWIPR